MLDEPFLAYANGQWTAATPGPDTVVRFPGAEQPVPVTEFGLPPIATIPRHVDVTYAQGLLNTDLVDQLRAVSPDLVAAMPAGPAPEQRRLQRWTHVVEAVGVDGRTACGEVEGADGYALTAIIAVEGARRLAADGAAARVLAPAAAFDPADFLDWLAPYGVRWHVEVR